MQIQVEGDPSGFAEEYPLEALEISTADYMAKVIWFGLAWFGWLVG
jgi:hypothetical protein